MSLEIFTTVDGYLSSAFIIPLRSKVDSGTGDLTRVVMDVFGDIPRHYNFAWDISEAHSSLLSETARLVT